MRKSRNSVRRALTLLLSVWMCVQCGTIAFAEMERTDESYSGTVLAAINTDYRASEDGKHFIGKTPYDFEDEEENAAPASAKQPQNPMELVWDQIEPMTPEEAQQAGGTVQAQRALRSYRVGDTRTITGYFTLPENEETFSSIMDLFSWIVGLSKENKVQVTCVYTNDVCTIWTEDVNAWPQENVEKLGQFVARTIPQMEELFGPAKIDTDRDGKFAIFIHSTGQSEEEIERQGGYVAGFFNPNDLIDASGNIGNVRMKSRFIEAMAVGSKADCFHVNIAVNDIDGISDVFVHEYQHYIHECYRYYGKTNKTVLKENETYIDEGFSTASEMILGQEDCERKYIEVFNAYQDGFSLVTWERHIANYGLVFPFFQYIRTRYAALTEDRSTDYPGKGIYRRVLESRDQSNQDNTLGIIADILYPADRYPALADTDARTRQLIYDFWLAVYHKNPQGDYGFNGEEWANALSVPTGFIESYGENNNMIRNGMAVFFVLNDGERGTADIFGTEEGLRFVALDEHVNAVTFDANGGLPASKTEYVLENECFPYFTPFKKGFSLIGWALEPDAQTPDFTPDDVIPVSGDSVLYAVWGPAKIAAADQEIVLQPDELESNFQFTPPADGVYYLESSADAWAEIVDPTDADFSAFMDSSQNGVYLFADSTYQIHLQFSDPEDPETAQDQQQEPQPATCTIRERKTYYSLYYLLYNEDDPQTMYDWMQQYGTTYTIIDEYYQWPGTSIIGWSTKPYQYRPEYRAGDEITLTKDTVLYAVFREWEALKPDKEHKLEADTEYFTFCPPDNALFRIVLKPKADGQEPNALIWGAYDSFEAVIDSETNTEYTLYGGETYYIEVNDAESVCMEFVSYALAHTLTLQVLNPITGKPSKSLSLKMHGSRTYILPRDYRPVMLMTTEFACWQDTETDELFYPGDVIELRQDRTLVALSTNLSVPIDEMDSILSYIGVLVKGIVVYIPVWLRLVLQRAVLLANPKLYSRI